MDLGYFYLYLQHILAATKFGMSDDPLGRGDVNRLKNSSFGVMNSCEDPDAVNLVDLPDPDPTRNYFCIEKMHIFFKLETYFENIQIISLCKLCN